MKGQGVGMGERNRGGTPRAACSQEGLSAGRSEGSLNSGGLEEGELLNQRLVSKHFVLIGQWRQAVQRIT